MAEVQDLKTTIPSTHTVKQIRVWVCPTPGCPDFYGDGSRADLTASYTGSKVENKHAEPLHTGPDGETLPRGIKHTRAQSPTCRTQGRLVERVLCATTVFVPLPPEPSAA
jgi:hypothetical protein